MLDSLDAVSAHREPDHTRRRRYERFFSFARNTADVTLMLAEAHGTEAEPTLPEYLTDMHIALGYREGPFPERILEIRKSRVQSHVRGLHHYAIHVNWGIEIYPSLQARLSSLRGRVRPVVPGATVGLEHPGARRGAGLPGRTRRG